MSTPVALHTGSRESSWARASKAAPATLGSVPFSRPWVGKPPAPVATSTASSRAIMRVLSVRLDAEGQGGGSPGRFLIQPPQEDSGVPLLGGAAGLHAFFQVRRGQEAEPGPQSGPVLILTALAKGRQDEQNQCVHRLPSGRMAR